MKEEELERIEAELKKKNKEYVKIYEDIVNKLHGKSLLIVVPVLAQIIGQSGVDRGIDCEDLCHIVFRVIENEYKQGPVNLNEKVQ